MKRHCKSVPTPKSLTSYKVFGGVFGARFEVGRKTNPSRTLLFRKVRTSTSCKPRPKRCWVGFCPTEQMKSPRQSPGCFFIVPTFTARHWVQRPGFQVGLQIPDPRGGGVVPSSFTSRSSANTILVLRLSSPVRVALGGFLLESFLLPLLLIQPLDLFFFSHRSYFPL